MSFGSGMGVGRGRGFNKMANMSVDLPKVETNVSSTTNGSANASNFADDDWNETPTESTWKSDSNNTSNGWSGGNGNSGGGGNTWSGGNSGGGGNSWSGGNSRSNDGGDKKGCHNCGQEGHFSRECSEPKTNKARDCFNCHKPGHMSKDCPEPRGGGGGGGGGGSRDCFNCQKPGHMSKDCPEPRGGGGGGGPRSCYKCQQEGHISKDCPNESSSRPGRDGGGDRKCHKCQEEGHMARDCPTAGDDGDRRGCFKCKEDGHMAKDCPNPDANPDGKPKASTYVPPELTENEDELFDNNATGINFKKYDSIEVKVSGSGTDKLKPISSFREAKLREYLLKNIEKHKYTDPTPVQKWCIPIISAKRDLMACAQTGSGKTAAFLLPMIQTMFEATDLPNNNMAETQEPWALIVAPTRELAVQIHTEVVKFTYGSVIKSAVLYGGTSVMSQKQRLQRGAHLIVGTPGRLLMFIDEGKISFAQLRYFVLDEADRLLDMGFKGDIEKMVNHETMPPKGERQTLMFSATFADEVQNLARDFLHDYLFLTVGIVGAANSDVTQRIIEVPQYDKRQKLMDVIKEMGMDRTLVFVETKRNTDFVATFLSQNDLPTTSIHGDREQREREEALNDFKSGRMPILMATAVAARGLDIKNVKHVVNFDLPSTIDEYVHRIGRTGRVGHEGMATSFYDPDKDGPLAADLVKILAGANQEIPSWLESAGRNGGGGRSGGGNRFGSRDTRKGQTVVSTDSSWSNGNSVANSAPVEEESWD